MSSNPQDMPEMDNWFDDEIEGILKDLEQETSSDGDAQGIDDLNNLFDESAFDESAFDENLFELDAPIARVETPQRMTLSLDQADAELEALFEDPAELEEAELDPYETSSWLELDSLISTGSSATVPPVPELPPISSQQNDDNLVGFEDLDNLFKEAEEDLALSIPEEMLLGSSYTNTNGHEEYSPTPDSTLQSLESSFSVSSTFRPSELEDLRELLGVTSSSSESETNDFFNDFNESTAPLSSSVAAWNTVPESLQFYDDIDQLESLLAEPPRFQPLEEPLNIQALEALIDSPVITAPVIVETPVPVVPVYTPAYTNYEAEDEFKDLEALLEQADRTMGGPPTMIAVGGQRLQPRNRPGKTKVFEQTMRVPVKQLDNLSNLIGELVVKRNRLEQDQERLRQFLDNLLNQAQSLSDVGGRMQDLYERTLLEGALLASRHTNRQSPKSTYSGEATVTVRDRGGFSGATQGGDQPLDALEMDRFTGFHLLSQEMIELIVRVRESTSDIQYLVDETDQVARTLRQVTTQLQEGMTKSRMVPFAQTADRLPRAIREVSMKLNKQVGLQVEGREVLIDKMILEHLYNPMTHLVNNAITHGIESPEERQRKGKSPEGEVSISAFLQGNQTLITVSDDGAGIDAERVKRKAIEKGVITPLEAHSMNEQDVYDLLFHAGFSTKDKADDFSGRGVGLDVVRTSLLEIRGSVAIDSTPGKGTTFSIRLPLTLSICKALCCLSDRARIAFPMDGVEDTKDYLPSDVVLNEEEHPCIHWQDMLLPIYRLGDLLNYNRQLSRGTVYGGKKEEEIVSIVILRGGASNLLAIQVDNVLGEEEIVIKQIEGPVPKPPGIAGATVRGDGSIMPIGDVLELIEIAQGRIRTDIGGGLWRKTATPVNQDLQMEPTVLIVDDSITVRELLSLSFSKAGYRVEQARDGQEAWEKLRSGLPCDLVFCDIEMPRMNGLELLSQMQSDEQLANIPIALLTSRGADRHRKVAARLGASGYFTKPYTEKDILDAAARMMQGEVLLQGSIKQPHSFLSRFKKAKQTNPGQFPPLQDEMDVSPRVLIIDDSVMVREMLSLTYRKAGYDTEVARDGQDAWEKLRSGLPCDLILCDIEMPRMNGLELLSRLQDDPQLSRIPVAMITSRGAQKMQRLAAEKGAKGYFVKPYIEEALLEASQRLMAGEMLLDVNALVED
jgi:chemosensory pili system protein ChpA (sensor histidine kinase/response regulator)